MRWMYFMITKKARGERKIMEQEFDRKGQEERERVKEGKSESKGEIRF